jgi:flagellin
MTRINTNLSSLTAQHSLKRSNASLETSLTRLSTGLRINTGKDDPAGLIASEQLRSEIVSIGQSIKNSERAGNIIATADAALGEVSSLLNDVRSLVQSSANKGAVSASEIAANQVQVDNALDAITRIAQTTVFAGQKLLNGTKSFSVSGTLGSFQSPTDIKVNSFDPALHTASAANDVSLNVTQEATKKSVSFKGTDFNTGASNSLLDLSVGTSTRTSSTVITNDFSVANATSSLGSLSTGSTRYTRVIEGGATGLADLAGAGSETITLDVTGNLGTESITVNVAAFKADTQVLTDAINATSATTGVFAAGSGAGGDLTLTSTRVGTTGTIATLNATAGQGAQETVRTIVPATGTQYSGMTAAGATEYVSFDLTGSVGTATGIQVNLQALKADSQALVDAINAETATTGVTATGSGVDGQITLTNATGGITGITFANVAGGNGAIAGDVTRFNTAISQGTQTLGDTDVTEFNAAITGSVVTAATDGALNTKTTVFTITGNKGSADISTAALAAGGLTGNDVIINNDFSTNAGISAFAALINTRTDTTGVVASVNGSGNLVLTSQGVGSTSLANITVGTAGADQTLINNASTKTTTTGTDGTSNTTTLELIGDLGRAVITINNDQVINDSTVLKNAINAVTSQTGITATGGGFGVDVSLNASKYGSAGVVTVNALAATNSADITLLNAAGTRKTVDAQNATGTISHGNGSGSFTASGEQFTYTDASISLEGTIDPSLTPSVRASRTIQRTTAGAGGLDSLTGAGTDTISFTLTGVVNGSQVSTTISNVNVAALKSDSRYLADLINATSTTSGVRASTTGATGDIVLESTTNGTAGQVAITATAATQAGDVTAFNNADTFTNIVAGANPAVANNFDVTGGALFQIGPTVNYANQININITSLDLSTLGRNITTTGNKGLSALKTGGTDSLDKADLTDAASIVDQAISEVATLRGKLGAIQKNAIESNIRSLQTSLEQVTAAESSIRDADFAVETANLTRSQILVQAGTNVLALANQSPQNVLSLLGR